MGLFGASLRTLGMSPGCHGAVPLQQPTLNLIGYCTGKPLCQSQNTSLLLWSLSQDSPACISVWSPPQGSLQGQTDLDW